MRLIAVTAALLAAVASAAINARQAADDRAPKSQWDRVYSLQQAKRGEALYVQNCAACHSGAEFSDSVDSTNSFVLHDVGTIKPSSGKRLGQLLTGFDTPTLKGLWNTGPYLHDGCAQTLEDRFGPCGGDKHGNTAILSPSEVTDLIAYLRTL